MESPAKLLAEHRKSIQSRAEQLEREIEKLQLDVRKKRDEIQQLQRDLREVEVAERVMAKIGNEGRMVATLGPVTSAITATLTPTNSVITMHDLSVPRAAIHVAENARDRGCVGLESKQYVEEIQSRWVIDAKDSTIQSALSRLVSRGELQKFGNLYGLPQKDKDPDVASIEASEVQPGPEQGHQS